MRKKLFVLGMAIMMAGAISACNAGNKTANESVSTESQTDSKQADTSESADSKKADDSKSADSKKKDVSFPEFSAKTVEGEEISNDVFKNSKLTVVNVWGSWCGPCVQEIPELQKLSENMKDKNVNVIGIAQDAGSNFQEVKEVLDKHSTGGVGDKVTIALIPILASMGYSVLKMSRKRTSVILGRNS